MKSVPSFVSSAFIVTATLSTAALAQTPGTAFTYQGRLEQGGAAASGPYDLRFRLWLHETDTDSPIGPILCKDNVSVTDGLFTTQLDFGPNVIIGFPLWMEIEARADATPGNCASGVFAPLTPRQPLTPTPYAVFATTAQTAGLRLPFDGTSGSGVLLRLTNTSNAPNTSTGYFQNNSTGNDCRAVTGIAAGDGGLLYGVYGRSDGSAGYGVYGRSSDSVGVGGFADNTSGVNYGVFGESASTSGRGLFGVATAATGTTYGVYGQTSSPNGYAGYFAGGRSYFSGNVGIGTTSPDYKLEVTDNTSGLTSAMYVRNNGTACAAIFESLGVGGSPAVSCFKQDGTALLVTSTSSSTATPLAVTGGSDSQPSGGGFIVCGSTNGTNVSIDNNEIMARNNGSPADLFLNNNGGNAIFHASGAGNVGIGTSAPQFPLDVNGLIRPRQGIWFNGALSPVTQQGGNFLSFGHPGISEDNLDYHDNRFEFGDSLGGGDNSEPEVWSGGFVTISDRRLKKDIEPLRDALARLRRLQGIRYRFDGAKVDPHAISAPEDSRVHLGFAAQEVEEVVPEAVRYAADRDRYALNYSTLIPLLVEAVKEQQATIEQQQATIAAQQAALDAIRADIRELQTPRP